MKHKITYSRKQLSYRILAFLVFVLCVAIHSNAAAFAGSGTEEDPFLITDADELYMLRSYLSRSYYFRLENDIDLTEFIEENFPEAGWSPIGNGGAFCGTFDGNGKTISGLVINSTGDNIGLFGQFRGRLKNLTVKGSVVGNDYVGGIVGLAELSSTTAATNIINCRFEGTVTGRSGVGGIVGKMNDGNYTRYMSIRQCGVKGTVKGSNYYTGGVVGYSNAHVTEQCWMSGEVYGTSDTGGICGHGEGRFIECYAKCDIKRGGSQYSNLYAGGIVGKLLGNYYSGDWACITRCQFVGNIEGNGPIGGVTYRADATFITDNIVRGTIKSGENSKVGGIITDMHRATVNNTYRYNTISGNVVACTSISTETTQSNPSYYAARIIALASIDSNNTIGTEGSTAENLALSTMDITLNGTAVATTDYAHHGTGTTMSFLKKKLCYTAKNWDFDTVWAIDPDLNDGFPYIQALESVIRELEADDEGGETTVISAPIAEKSTSWMSGFFTVDGRKVKEPTHKGVYIRDGRKVVIK